MRPKTPLETNVFAFLCFGLQLFPANEEKGYKFLVLLRKHGWSWRLKDRGVHGSSRTMKMFRKHSVTSSSNSEFSLPQRELITTHRFVWFRFQWDLCNYWTREILSQSCNLNLFPFFKDSGESKLVYETFNQTKECSPYKKSKWKIKRTVRSTSYKTRYANSD